MRLTSVPLSLIAALALPVSARILHDRLGDHAAVPAGQQCQFGSSPGLHSGDVIQQSHAGRHTTELAQLALLELALMEAKP
ncbi:hypothetical protein GCM10007907_08950 [Chitinimonas prasina]|uniref:Secreted protein n=1 Tax=Chitinimonas prasina TaxID=1434937 RepID=A0ABQ5YAX2_9NEIS|nr:hypothetical protein [Chitinimonas prasina]GLR12105.1 hypothetical protein GCM10007907_08950 [Chitinimonas prasina]